MKHNLFWLFIFAGARSQRCKQEDAASLGSVDSAEIEKDLDNLLPSLPTVLHFRNRTEHLTMSRKGKYLIFCWSRIEHRHKSI